MDQAHNYEKILEILEKNKPNTVKDLISQVELDFGIPQKNALELVISLENQGRIHLTEQTTIVPKKITEYILSAHALWFRIITLVSFTTIVAVFIIHEKSYPAVYIRYTLGALYVLFLPGYSLIKTLFPIKEINLVERTTFSVGTSLALVPIVGLLLNYTPWGITLVPIIISLLLLTLSLAFIGLLREHNIMRSRTHTIDY